MTPPDEITPNPPPQSDSYFPILLVECVCWRPGPSIILDGHDLNRPAIDTACPRPTSKSCRPSCAIASLPVRWRAGQLKNELLGPRTNRGGNGWGLPLGIARNRCRRNCSVCRCARCGVAASYGNRSSPFVLPGQLLLRVPPDPGSSQTEHHRGASSAASVARTIHSSRTLRRPMHGASAYPRDALGCYQ